MAKLKVTPEMKKQIEMAEMLAKAITADFGTEIYAIDLLDLLAVLDLALTNGDAVPVREAYFVGLGVLPEMGE